MQYSQKHHIDVTAKAAGAVIYNESHEFLLVQELQGSKKGLWHIPSGTMELDEFPVDTAQREIKEETGLHLELANYLNIYVGCFDDGDLVIRHVWVCAFPKGQTIKTELVEEIGACQFFSLAEIQQLYRDDKLRMHQTKLMIEDANRYLAAKN